MADFAEGQRATQYLVARDHPDLENNFDARLAQYDELRREGELAKLKDKIQAAIDEHYEWGQFEVWWQNTARTQQVDSGTQQVDSGTVRVHDSGTVRVHDSGTVRVHNSNIITFSHDDDGLRRVLANASQLTSSKKRVLWAW